MLVIDLMNILLSEGVIVPGVLGKRIKEAEVSL
jgi:hypothetical protein